MNVLKRRQQEHTKLMRVGDLSRKANSFGLFRTSDALMRIQREKVQMSHASNPEKHRRNLLREIGRSEILLDEEHEDVALASKADWRSKRGVMGLVGILALQGANLITNLVPPEMVRAFFDRSEGHINMMIALGLMALTIIPARDLLFVRRFDRLKEDIEGILERLKKEL